MGIVRDSFVIFKNWADAINTLPDEYQLETYKALVEYGTTGVIPQNLSPVANAMLISFSVNMERSVARYASSVENGKLGGRPKKSTNQQEPTQENENPEKPNITQENLHEPTRNLNVYVDDNVNVDDDVYEDVNVGFGKKVSKKVGDISACARDTCTHELNTKKHKVESYEQVMVDFCVVSDGLRDALFEFIRHCQLNGRMVTNEKLKQMILRLDFYYHNDDVKKIKAVQKAINSGYFDIPELRDGI